MPRLLRTALLLVAALALPAGALAAAGQHARPRQGAHLLLPDLVAAEPAELVLQHVGGGWRLGFLSAAENLGAGPLIVVGHRPPGQLDMTGRQVVERSDGSTLTSGPVGQLYYVVNPTHHHWHFQGFMTYQLVRAVDHHLVGQGQKQGFCLGDRYVAPRDDDVTLPELSGKPAHKVFTGLCDWGRPHATAVREGISVGYGDDYSPVREGQYVSLDGVPAGTYFLVVRVNPTRVLRESDYANDVSSLVFDLGWGPGHRPELRVRGRCRGTAFCPPAT